MRKLFVSVIFVCTVFSIPSRSESNCSKDLDKLVSKATWPAKPLDSDFLAAESNVRLQAYLILKEELDNSIDQTWWQPKGRYFKAIYQAKQSKRSVIALFDRKDGLWAYQLKYKAEIKNVCIHYHGLSTALLDLVGKAK